MGCVLGQQDETGKKEYAIYFLSKKFTDCEIKYSQLEKTCCALAWAARRLRQYMLNHTTLLISKMDPVKYIFEKPALIGRVARWQIKEMCNPSPAIQCVIPLLTLHVDALWILTQDLLLSRSYV